MELLSHAHIILLGLLLLVLGYLTAQNRFAERRLLLYRAWSNVSWAILILVLGEFIQALAIVEADPMSIVAIHQWTVPFVYLFLFFAVRKIAYLFLPNKEDHEKEPFRPLPKSVTKRFDVSGAKARNLHATRLKE